MPKIALLLSRPSSGPMMKGREYEGGDDMMGECDGDKHDSPELEAMFEAFTASLGLEPKDPEKARRRFAALVNMVRY